MKDSIERIRGPKLKKLFIVYVLRFFRLLFVAEEHLQLKLSNFGYLFSVSIVGIMQLNTFQSQELNSVLCSSDLAASAVVWGLATSTIY